MVDGSPPGQPTHDIHGLAPATRAPARVPGGYPEGRHIPRRGCAGNQVVTVGRVHQDLLVLIATTPLPRPVQSVTRPPEQVVCHGDLACAVVIVGIRVLGHCQCLTQASTAGGALARTGGCEPLRSSEPPSERGVGVPSSRSLATATHEAT